jgi:hypothetical protein
MGESSSNASSPLKNEEYQPFVRSTVKDNQVQPKDGDRNASDKTLLGENKVDPSMKTSARVEERNIGQPSERSNVGEQCIGERTTRVDDRINKVQTLGGIDGPGASTQQGRRPILGEQPSGERTGRTAQIIGSDKTADTTQPGNNNGGSDIRIGAHQGDGSKSIWQNIFGGQHTTSDNTGDKHVSTDRVVGDKTGDRVVGDKIGDRVVGDKSSDRIVGDRTGDRAVGDKIGDRVIGDKGGDRIIGDKTGGRIFGDERIGDRTTAGERILGSQLGERIGDLPGDHTLAGDKNTLGENSPFTIRMNDQDIPIHGLIQDRIRSFNSSVDRVFDNLSQRVRAPEVQDWLQKHPATVFENLKNTEVRDCVVKFMALVETRMLPDRLTDGMKKIVRLAEDIGKDTMRNLVKRVQRTPEGHAPKFHDFTSKVKFSFATMVRLVIKEISAPRESRQQTAITNLVETARNILNAHFGDKLASKPNGARINNMDQPCGKSIRISHRTPHSIVKSDTAKQIKPIGVPAEVPVRQVKTIKPVETPTVKIVKPAETTKTTKPVETHTVRIVKPVEPQTRPAQPQTRPAQPQKPADAPTRPSVDGERAPFREMQEAIRVLEPRVNNICHACGSVNLDGAVKCTLCKKELKTKQGKKTTRGSLRSSIRPEPPCARFPRLRSPDSAPAGKHRNL